MNRLKAVSVLMTLGSIAIVTALTLQATPAISLSTFSAQGIGRYNAPSTPLPGIMCAVPFTTTSVIPNNYTVANAAVIASYTGLALVPSPTYPVSPTQPAQVAAVDNWFVLFNTTLGFQYTFQADPDGVGNYNIGMEIYSWTSGALALVASNVDTSDGNGAKITTSFSGIGPYYIRIFQISNYCSGGTYTLHFSYMPLPPTPSFGYGMVMAGPDNLWPQWIGFNYQLVFTSPVLSGRNELMQLAVNAADLDDLSAMQNRVSQIVSANGSVESFQIGNDPNLSSGWNVPPDALGYSQVLCAAYQSIKQARPWALVVSGGLATTGRVAGTWNGHLGHDGSKQDEREYLKEFIVAGGGDCLDALGYNALGFGTNFDATPDVNGGTPETDCANGLCFRSVEKANAIMQSHGLTKPMWITEVGWLTAPPLSCRSDSRWQGRTGQIVTPAQQSDNLVGAFHYARFHWPWLKAMFVFNLDFNLAPWYDECEPMRYYSVVGQPAFLALGAMSKPQEVYQVYLPVFQK